MFGLNYVSELVKKYLNFRRRQVRGISIGNNVRIHKTARLEIKYGGEIFIDDNCEFNEGVLIQTYGGKIRIGKNCSINPYTIIYGHGDTTIGDDVLIAGHCMIIPNNHNFQRRDIPINLQGNTGKGITIGSDVWIGHGCSILDGISIGKGAVIAAGAVVNKSVEAYTIVAGNPARKIKNR